MPSLFDIAFEGYTKPLEAEQLQNQVAMGRIETQAAQVGLQNQLAAQSQLQKIWGSADSNGAISTALTDPSQQSLPKLMATAQTYFATGNAQAGAQLMNSISMMGYRNLEGQKIQAGIQKQKISQVASALASVTDQQSYQEALNTLEAEGIAPESLGLTTDYSSNQGAVDRWVAAGKTAHQQTLEEFNDQKMQNSEYWNGVRAGFQKQRLADDQRRIQIQQDVLNQRIVMDSFRQNEAKIHDARAQEALDMKKLGKDARGYTNATKVQKPELKLAQDIFSLSDLTKDLPDNLRNTYSAMAAMRAKQMIADKMKNEGTDEYTQEDFDSAINEVMVDFKNQGLFDPSGKTSGLFGGDPTFQFKQPAARPTGPGPAKATPKNTGNPSDATSYSDLPSLQAAVKTGKVPRDQAVEYARKKGWVQ